MTKLSIIIPTYNEGQYIEKLLESIEKQDFKDYEVIISDSKSTDSTIAIAKKYGVKTIIGPKKGPGYARNLAVKSAKGEVLLFLDADVILPKNDTLSKVIHAIDKENCVGGTSTFKALDGTRRAKMIFRLASKLISFLYLIKKPICAPGFFIFSRKDIFDKVNGFDDALYIAEDHDFVSRIRKYGKMKLLKEDILVSARRVKSGGIKTILKDLNNTILLFLHGKEYIKKKNIKILSVNDLEGSYK